MRQTKYFVCILIVFHLVGCTDSNEKAVSKEAVTDTPSNIGEFLVSDSFNVGNNVFVRTLTSNPKNKSMWIGTSVGVLNVDVKSSQVSQTFTRDNGLANEYVFASIVANNGDVWFGSNGGGISRLRNGEWKTYFPMHGLADYWVYSFTEQSNEALWVGTWAGLSRFDYETEQFTTYVKELVNEWVYGLDVDSKGRVWIGTEGGVNMYDNADWHVWTHKDGLGAPNTQNLGFSTNTGLGTRSRHDLSVMVGGKDSYNPNYVFCIKISHDDVVWAGTWGGGVSFFNGEKWQNLTSKDGLAGDIVYSIEIDKQGLYWFGTNKGLSVYDGKHWQTLTKDDGLMDSHVYALAVTGENKIWAGTRNGVAVIEKP